MRKFIFIIAFLIPFLGYANDVKVNNVSVHLFLEKSGTFSKDITTMKEFLTHNFRPMGDSIPEGEIFHSYLIKIRFSSDEEVFSKGKVANVKVVNDKDNSVVIDQPITDVYIGPEKLLYKSIFVSGHECDFQTLVVRSKGKTISKKLPFHCGE